MGTQLDTFYDQWCKHGNHYISNNPGESGKNLNENNNNDDMDNNRKNNNKQQQGKQRRQQEQ